MPAGTKIATCCYCGARAALILTGTVRHELACASCGAPLHDLKGFPKPVEHAVRPARGTGPKSTGRKKSQTKPKKAGKTRKPGKARGFLSEAFDLIEDIFD